jgi:hypothetical protein
MNTRNRSIRITQLPLAVLLLWAADWVSANQLNLWATIGDNATLGDMGDLFDPLLTFIGQSTSILAVAIAITAVVIAWARGYRRAATVVVALFAVIVTLGLFLSVLYMVLSLTGFKQGTDGMKLLWDGLTIWGMNIAIFAVWYWLIDGSGPLIRNSPESTRRDFLFPLQANPQPGYANWHPAPMDYLFLSFTTSTAFSPTDVIPLSHRAKGFMAVQAVLAVITNTMVVARAIGIIN